MTAYKVVGRHTAETSRYQPRSHDYVQANKRTYVSLEDFERYAPGTAQRYRDYCKYTVEFYELQQSGEWKRIYPDWYKPRDVV